MYSYIHVAQANNTDPGRKKKKTKTTTIHGKFFQQLAVHCFPPDGRWVYGIRHTVYGIYGIWSLSV